ncbi:MAG: hypothetical protein QXG18_02995 [Candidatus Pacearchaeota archaeon]
MVNNLENIERKISLSFHYVKKDILRLNDNLQDLTKKIQHLSLNHASLLGRISKLENKLRKRRKKKKVRKYL